MIRIFRRIAKVLRPAPRTLPSVDAYARWASSYPPRPHNPLMQIEQRAMLDLLPELTGKDVLDLACGTGRYGVIAMERGARHVVGLDNSLAMLRAGGLQRAALATTEALPQASESIDVVICAMALGHLPELDLSLAEIGRVLRTGGTGLVSDFHPFAALSGGMRTFTAPDGQVYSVEHHVHLYSDYHHTAAAAGLQVTAVAEPALDRHIAPAGFAKTPVVIVYRFEKWVEQD